MKTDRNKLVDDDALLAVCRTTYRRIVEKNWSFAAAREAARFELQRAGFDVVNEDDDISAGLQTVVVMLADGRYVQRDAVGGWHVHRNPAAG